VRASARGVVQGGIMRSAHTTPVTWILTLPFTTTLTKEDAHEVSKLQVTVAS
jgi:hypothetical protein